MVRSVLDQLDIDYERIDVPWAHHERRNVFEVSGQYMVPVLVDDEVVMSDEYQIIDYLKKTYSVRS